MSLSRRDLLLGVAASVALAPATARADDLPPIDDILAKIARARAGLKTLVGPFTQVRKIGMLATDVKSTGQMTLVPPDRLRWELLPPDDVVYWVTPEGLAYRSKSGGGRVPGNAAKVAAVLADLRAVLGGDLGSLRARYDLRLLSATNGAAFEATPRKPMPGMQKIAFALAADLARPTRATLFESPRDKSDIVFGELQRDVVVDPAKMRPPLNEAPPEFWPERRAGSILARMSETSNAARDLRDENRDGYGGPERRRHRVYVTKNTEYHFRDGFCIAVRDRRTGDFLHGHLALRRRVHGGLKFFLNGAIQPNPGEPNPGEALYFATDGRDLVTSPLERVERPSKNIVQAYSTGKKK